MGKAHPARRNTPSFRNCRNTYLFLFLLFPVPCPYHQSRAFHKIKEQSETFGKIPGGFKIIYGLFRIGKRVDFRPKLCELFAYVPVGSVEHLMLKEMSRSGRMTQLFPIKIKFLCQPSQSQRIRLRPLCFCPLENKYICSAFKPVVYGSHPDGQLSITSIFGTSAPVRSYDEYSLLFRPAAAFFTSAAVTDSTVFSMSSSSVIPSSISFILLLTAPLLLSSPAFMSLRTVLLADSKVCRLCGNCLSLVNKFYRFFLASGSNSAVYYINHSEPHQFCPYIVAKPLVLPYFIIKYG